MVFLVTAILFLVYQNPHDIPYQTTFEKHSNELAQINEKSKEYQLLEDVQRFNETKKLMQEKLKKISLDYMGLKISKVDLIDGYYPFRTTDELIERFDLEPSSICAFEKKIPLHFQIISQTDKFQMFTKKYSQYPIELSIMDERNSLSSIHYGLYATNLENQHASTYFHVNSCTSEITDKEPYFLHCFDEKNDYRFATFNKDDIMASFSNAHFCKIDLDPWRQSLYDYSKTLQEKRRQLEQESMSGITDQESQRSFFSEMNKLGNLGNIVGHMVHGKYDDQNTQDMIKQYEKQYGNLPDDLLELIERRNEN